MRRDLCGVNRRLFVAFRSQCYTACMEANTPLVTRKVRIPNVGLLSMYQQLVTVSRVSGDRYPTAFLRMKGEVTTDFYEITGFIIRIF